MTSPNLGAAGASGGTGPSQIADWYQQFDTPWNDQWIINPPVGAANTVTIAAASGASGASGGTGGGPPGPASPGYVWRSDGMGGWQQVKSSIQTDRISDLSKRDKSLITAVFQDATPLLAAWENASDALFNALLGGFGSLENFVEILVKVLTGAEVDLSFISEGAQFFLELLQSIFGPVAVLFQWVWENIGEDVFQSIVEFLGYVWEFFSDVADDLGVAVRPILDAIVNILGVLWAVFGDVVESVLQPASDFLKWVFQNFGEVVETFLKPVIQWLFDLWENIGEPVLTGFLTFFGGLWDGIGQPILQGIFGFLEWLITNVSVPLLEDFFTFVANVLDPFDGINVLEAVVMFFKNIIDSFGSIAAGLPTFGDLGTAISSAIAGVIDTVGAWVIGLINGLTGGAFGLVLDALDAVIGWASTLPGIGQIVSAIVPVGWRNAVGAAASSLADLKEHAAEIVKTDSVIYSGNLQGQIPTDLLPVVSPGLVGDTRPNLLSDAGFKSAAALQSGSGWSWDSGTSRTVGDGGSAMVLGDGGVKQLFSNLVAVSPGQEIEVSVYVKWSKPSIARPTFSVGLRGYDGATIRFTQSVASLANVVPATGGWSEIKGTYLIPASPNLTHVRLFLSVVNSPSGSTTWFDEAAMRKVSLIQPTLVHGVGANAVTLADDIENAVGVTEYQLLLDRVAKKTGASLADVQATIDDFLDGDSELSGDQIKGGNIAATYISELRQTWSTVKTGIGGPTAPADQSLSAAYAALDSWRVVIRDNGSSLLAALAATNDSSAKVSALTADFQALRQYVQLVADDARKAVVQVGLAPTAPVTIPGQTPPTYTSVRDEFNRSVVGANWITGQRVSNYGSMIVDGNNAVFSMPDFDFGSLGSARFNVYSAVYSGGNSLSDYQKVYVSLSSSPGDPLIGESGFNDLIGRAASGVVCVVARFYNDDARTVKLFLRLGSYETDSFNPSNTFATFNRPEGKLTSGTSLEFLVGVKAQSNASRCMVKVGNWTSGTYAFDSSRLPTLGRGWGFGGGNGRSGGSVQKPGLVNFWGGEDQT